MVLRDLLVIIPRLSLSVPQLHVSHAALQESPGDQRLAAVYAGAVHLDDVLRLAGQLEGFGRLNLHPEGQLERLNPCIKPRVHSLEAVFGIQPGQEIELTPLRLRAGLRVLMFSIILSSSWCSESMYVP